MPYVPSEKTDGKSQDRNIIDKAVEVTAREIAGSVLGNFELLAAYKKAFAAIAFDVTGLYFKRETESSVEPIADAVWKTGLVYGYEGAFLGELNYAITRLIQRVPQVMVELKKWQPKDELRYWLYAITVQALTFVAKQYNFPNECDLGVGGVFEDIKDEYKRRVNTSYEAAQIIKSGDCYDTPYYTRLVEVLSQTGEHVGHLEIMLQRSQETLHVDVLPLKLVLVTEVPHVAISDATGYTG